MTNLENGVLVCDRTGADVSLVASEELRQVALSDPDEPAAPSTVRWGGRWHCPLDGSPMAETGGIVSCSSCRRAIPGRLLYQLIEFNAHPR